MSKNEDFIHLDADKNIAKEELTAASAKALEDVSRTHGAPFKNLGNPKYLSENLAGIGEGLLQACRECFDPIAIKQSIIQTADAVKNAGKYAATKIAVGDLKGVAEDAGVVGSRIEKAGENYLKLSAKEQGRILGHDLLPLMLPDGFGIIANTTKLRDIAKVAEVAEYLPSKAMLKSLDSAYEGLHPLEREIANRADVKIIPYEKAIHANNPKLTERTLGFYDDTNKIIGVAEKAKYRGKWVAHKEIEFTLKHEIGHMVNRCADPRCVRISDRPEFVRAFEKDANKISGKVLSGLDLSFDDKKKSCDEVYAELYAHASGGVTADGRSNQIRRCFPTCFDYVRGVNYAKY